MGQAHSFRETGLNTRHHRPPGRQSRSDRSAEGGTPSPSGRLEAATGYVGAVTEQVRAALAQQERYRAQRERAERVPGRASRPNGTARDGALTKVRFVLKSTITWL